MVLWGHKTIAMFDLWTLQHIASGIAMAFVAGLIVKKIAQRYEINAVSQQIILLLMVLAASLLWECVEHYLESGAVRGEIGLRISHWFQGVEHWTNRIIGDTLAVLLGWYLYTKNKWLAIPAKVFSVLWMALHIVIFSDSMYLHRLMGH